MNDDEEDADLRTLVEKLWARRAQIEPVIAGAEAWVETIIDSDSSRIAWSCDVEIMRKLSAMGIGWVVITWSTEEDGESE